MNKTILLGAFVAAVAVTAAGCGSHSDNNSSAPPQQSSTHTSSTPSSPPTTASAPPSSTASAPPPATAPTVPPATSASSASPTGHPTNTGDPRCHTSGLSAQLRPQDAAAGNRYATLVLTNTTDHACRIYGYGGIKIGSSSASVPSSQHRDPSAPPELLSLPAGGHAHSTLHWGAVPGTGDEQTGTCEPVPTYLLVTPPDETAPLRIGWSFGPVCERGTIDQTAYRVGVS